MPEYELNIKNNYKIADNVYRMDFHLSERVEYIQCGQFLNLSLGRAELLLRRPFGITFYDETNKIISICYQKVGKGTDIMRGMKAGQVLTATLPLGNGFILPEEYKTVALIGGGAGIFPLRALPLTYPDKKYYSFLGFRTVSNICLNQDFESFSETKIVTDDGSNGVKGNALNAFFQSCNSIKPDVILACGPTAMLKALKAGLEQSNSVIPAFVSLEERMGCGVGACLACSCRLKNVDGEINNARVCRDGPVFSIREVLFD